MQMIGKALLAALLCQASLAAECHDEQCNDETSLLQHRQTVSRSTAESVAESFLDRASAWEHRRKVTHEAGKQHPHHEWPNHENPLLCFAREAKADPELLGMISASPKLQQIQQEMKGNPLASYNHMMNKEVRNFLKISYAKISPKCLNGPGQKQGEVEPAEVPTFDGTPLSEMGPLALLGMLSTVNTPMIQNPVVTCVMQGMQSNQELRDMIQNSPKLTQIEKEIQVNPQAGYKYMNDPDVQPFLSAAYQNLVPGCMGSSAPISSAQEKAGLDAVTQQATQQGMPESPPIARYTAPQSQPMALFGVEDTPLECFMRGIDEEPELVQMIQGSQKLQQIHEEMKANPMSGYKYMQDPDVKPFLDLAKVKLTQKCMGGQAMPAMPQTPMSCFTDGIASDPQLSGMIMASPKLQQIQQEMATNPMAGYQYMTDPEVKPFLSAAYIKLMPVCMAGGGAQGMALIGGQANMIVMNDPELASMLEESPKLQRVMMDVQTNPLAGYKYMMDAEVLPFLDKAVEIMIPNMGDTSVMFMNENSMTFRLLGENREKLSALQSDSTISFSSSAILEHSHDTQADAQTGWPLCSGLPC